MVCAVTSALVCLAEGEGIVESESWRVKTVPSFCKLVPWLEADVLIDFLLFRITFVFHLQASDFLLHGYPFPNFQTLTLGMGLVQSKKAPTVSSKDKAILELKVQRDKLKQYEKKVCLRDPGRN